ncbi:type II toxin-antitoxin system VapC family toxin [Luteococcus sediminum]
MYLLDTNVLSEYRKPSADQGVVRWMARREPVDLHLSAITVFEIEIGVRRVERRDKDQGRRLREWFTSGILEQFHGRILPVDAAVALQSAAMQVPDPRPERDCFIAATAAVHGLAVVTRNTKDFSPMGVALVNPWQA